MFSMREIDRERDGTSHVQKVLILQSATWHWAWIQARPETKMFTVYMKRDIFWIFGQTTKFGAQIQLIEKWMDGGKIRECKKGCENWLNLNKVYKVKMFHLSRTKPKIISISVIHWTSSESLSFSWPKYRGVICVQNLWVFKLNLRETFVHWWTEQWQRLPTLEHALISCSTFTETKNHTINQVDVGKSLYFYSHTKRRTKSMFLSIDSYVSQSTFIIHLKSFRFPKLLLSYFFIVIHSLV